MLEKGVVGLFFLARNTNGDQTWEGRRESIILNNKVLKLNILNIILFKKNYLIVRRKNVCVDFTELPRCTGLKNILSLDFTESRHCTGPIQ